MSEEKVSAPADAPKGDPSDEDIIDLAVEPLGIDFDRMPYVVVKFARALLARYATPANAALEYLETHGARIRDRKSVV